MMLKRFLAWLLAVVMLLSTMPVFAVSTQKELAQEKEETLVREVLGETRVDKKTYCTATVADDFAENTVLVLLNKEASFAKDVFTPQDFPEIACVTVEDISRGGKELLDAQQEALAKRNTTARQLVLDMHKAENKAAYKETLPDVLLDCDGRGLFLVNAENYRRILKITLEKPGKAAVLEAIKALEKREDVLCATPDMLMEPCFEPNDTEYSVQWGAERISLPAAWSITTGAEQVTVAVIDSGIDATHPDLAGKVDATNSIDFTVTSGNTNGSTSARSVTNSALVDGRGHGTHVAGIIAATGNNAIGVAGCNFNANFVSYKVFPSEGSGSFSNVLSSIVEAQDCRIPIANYSGGHKKEDYEDVSALYAYELVVNYYAGVLICSAGNDNQNTDIDAHYPSCLTNDNIISVGATDTWDEGTMLEQDFKASFSNYGATSVDLFAPGKNIYSTLSSLDCEEHSAPASSCTGGCYGVKGGTSMAAPFVTGVAALIKSLPNNSFTGTQIKSFILQNVDVLPTLSGYCVTGGRLNAHKALAAAVHSMDGTFYNTTDNGQVFVLVGGAPVYVSNWNNVGGIQPYVNISRAELNNFFAYPIDGTFVTSSDGRKYVFAGGAPMHVYNWSMVGCTASDTVTLIDHVAVANLDHMRYRPVDNTYVYTLLNTIFRFQNGVPTEVYSIDQLSSCQPATLVEMADYYNTAYSFSTAYTWRLYVGKTNTVGLSHNAANKVDYVKFTAPYGGVYQFTSSYAVGDVAAVLYNGNQAWLAQNDNNGTSSNFSITYQLTAGQTYYIAIYNANSSTTTYGSYNLNITRLNS